MKSHTDYITFNTDERRAFVRITENVQQAVEESGVREGMVLVSAMHITAGVWVNDDEPGIQAGGSRRTTSPASCFRIPATTGITAVARTTATPT